MTIVSKINSKSGPIGSVIMRSVTNHNLTYSYVKKLHFTFLFSCMYCYVVIEEL